ncbi:MAG: spermidine/putrescine ABC transporter substrate-binding protein [Planctomycetia bacterium]|nr:spermidine/putrescine ABC transporter substrate-binding protein [Planctomycetia bacterium]
MIRPVGWLAMGLAVTGLAAMLLLTGCQRGPEKQKLYFYTWADYIDENTVREFEEAYHCEVVFDYFDSNESMLAKLKAENIGYDVILPTTYMVEIMKREGMIRPLDHAKIPNAVKGIDRRLAAKVGDENLEYSVPYYIGLTAFGYNAEKLGKAPDSWRIYENTALAGRMTLLEDMRAVIGAALITLGYDMNSVDPRQLEEARDLVIRWKANIAKFGVDDVKQGLASGEFFVVQGYSGDILQFTVEDPNIRLAIPKEGTILAIDHFVIPTNASNPELAYQFINFMCDPKNAGRNLERTQYLVPIEGVQNYVSEAMKSSPIFLISDKEFERAQLTQDLGTDIEKFSAIWDQIKAAH